jgi:hypothetical protein
MIGKPATAKNLSLDDIWPTLSIEYARSMMPFNTCP